MANLILLIVCGLLTAAVCHDDTCYNKFEYEFHVLQKLAEHEQQVASLLSKLQDVQKPVSVSSSYIRWGRKVCPTSATLVYEGYAAGSHYNHTGAAADFLCLPTNPDWNKYTDGFQSYGRIYGAEYETIYLNDWRYLYEYDVPCALCRIPRSDVVMVPGKNVCHQDYMLEYHGYLMAGAYNHAAASEYVCVDVDPETIADTSANNNGKLFYHVEAECGALKCPPYVNGRELTCAVCSFSKQV